MDKEAHRWFPGLGWGQVTAGTQPGGIWTATPRSAGKPGQTGKLPKRKAALRGGLDGQQQDAQACFALRRRSAAPAKARPPRISP